MPHEIAFNLRFGLDQLPAWEATYERQMRPEKLKQEKELLEVAGPRARNQGYCSKQDLQMLARWKSRRIGGHIAANSEQLVQEVTGIALASRCEEMRIRSLLILRGVSWPMASVVLHFAHEAAYPVLDYRALWSVGVTAPTTYEFDLWWSYTEYCRRLVGEAGCSMRTLDRALWAYSRRYQP